jgi:tetratricopeptide (TPR) repeat protein
MYEFYVGKRNLLRVFICGMILILHGTAIAQEISTEIIISYDAGADVPYEFVALWKSGVRYELENQAISVEFVEGQHDAAMLYAHFLGDNFVDLRLLQSPLADLSPILHERAGGHVIWYGSVPSTLALIYYKRGECPREFWAILAYFGEYALPFYEAGCAALKGDYATAISNYESLAYATKSERAAINLAWAYIKNNQPEDARNIINKFLVSEELLPYRAQLEALLFDYAGALASIDAALEINPDNAEFHTIRGEIHLLLYEWENARADFNQAVELDPLYADAYFQRGILHYTMIERSAAIVDFEQYLTLAPHGRYAEQAAKYIDSLKIEIEASGD